MPACVGGVERVAHLLEDGQRSAGGSGPRCDALLEGSPSSSGMTK